MCANASYNAGVYSLSSSGVVGICLPSGHRISTWSDWVVSATARMQFTLAKLVASWTFAENLISASCGMFIFNRKQSTFNVSQLRENSSLMLMHILTI